MDISKIIGSVSHLAPKQRTAHLGSFKAILSEKKEAQKSASSPLGIALDTMATNHKMAAKSVKTFLSRTDYTPEKLLSVQYKTSVLFLREQMFSKTIETAANTLKNFTQMQV